MGDKANNVVVARGVHVRYKTTQDRRLLSRRREQKFTDIHAVRGVSFYLQRGETLGIVGHNGSGKSTLMRAVAGLMPLSEGMIVAATRPSLLGVSAALHNRVSGRRNLYRGCLALGMSRRDIDKRIDELIEFAGLTDFIDMPIDSYSTGMRARLAFAIATVVEPEILLLDEAMSGGDREFRERAAARLKEIQDAAGSIIVVSHNTNMLAGMCDRAMWMRKGRIAMHGAVDEVIAEYETGKADRPTRSV